MASRTRKASSCRLRGAGSKFNRSISLSFVISPVVAEPNRMILSGRATVRMRRDRALIWHTRVNDIWGEAEAFDAIPAALWMGRPAEAEALIRESLARADRVGHTNVIWACKGFTVSLHVARGDLAEAERAAAAAFEYGQSISAGWLFSSLVTTGTVAHYRGKFDEACAWFRRGMEMEKRSFMSGMPSAGLFWTLAAQG